MNGGSDPMIGTLVDGRYRIVAEIGRGAMGVVYEAWQAELGRRVAIKMLAPAWAKDEVAIARFQREARAAGAIGHGNIVFVFDLGRLYDGRPYLVMEHVEGLSLATLARDTAPLAPRRVVEIVTAIAAALDAIHDAGFVHRDVKPDNVILTRHASGDERLVLLDFGLAALADPRRRDIRFSADGQIHGTPHYMSPEAATGDIPDRRGDVYSLAVVAFELLTGRLPFEGESPARVLVQQVTRPAPRLAERSRLPFGRELETAIAMGLAKLPAQRPESAGAFARLLRTAVERAEAAARPAAAGSSAPPPAHTSSWPPIRAWLGTLGGMLGLSETHAE